jgi:hypothetical protein
MIQFDNKGFITPYDVVDTDLNEFEQTFVFNEHRAKIFQEYQLFLQSIQNLGISTFYQWINGSFTSMKMNPNDIDVVTFVPFQDYEKHQTFFDKLFLNRYSTKIDCYFIKTFPTNHPDFNDFRGDELDFWHKFTKTVKKQGRSHIKISKGLVKIEFNNV